MKEKILHILPANTFTMPFVDFTNKEFDSKNQFFIFTSDPGKDFTEKHKNIKVLKNRSLLRFNVLSNIFLFFKYMKRSNKIILHGLPPINYFILFPWAYKKSYWVIYGYEIYPSKGSVNHKFERIKKYILKNVAGHLTHIKGDSIIANKLFNSNVKFLYTPIYLSNVTLTENFTRNCFMKNGTLNILIGNSASPTNNHLESLKQLEIYKNREINIYCPLSYGNYPEYKEKVINEGKRIFHSKFTPILKFMSREEYDKFLNKVDVVVFNHNRQEAMGVTISLLGMGKIIYMNEETTSYKSLKDRGFSVFTNEQILNDGLFKFRDVSNNLILVQSYYSPEVLKKSWEEIYHIK